MRSIFEEVKTTCLDLIQQPRTSWQLISNLRSPRVCVYKKGRNVLFIGATFIGRITFTKMNLWCSLYLQYQQNLPTLFLIQLALMQDYRRLTFYINFEINRRDFTVQIEMVTVLSKLFWFLKNPKIVTCVENVNQTSCQF